MNDEKNQAKEAEPYRDAKKIELHFLVRSQRQMHAMMLRFVEAVDECAAELLGCDVVAADVDEVSGDDFAHLRDQIGGYPEPRKLKVEALVRNPRQMSGLLSTMVEELGICGAEPLEVNLRATMLLSESRLAIGRKHTPEERGVVPRSAREEVGDDGDGAEESAPPKPKRGRPRKPRAAANGAAPPATDAAAAPVAEQSSIAGV